MPLITTTIGFYPGPPQDQRDVGIDIPTDGEAKRDHYVYYHCRHLGGIDFSKIKTKVFRNGTAVDDVPVITGKITAGRSFLDKDWREASRIERPVKITIPGPMTIVDSLVNEFYEDDAELYRDIIVALNQEIHSLAKAGCRYIQIDEPVFVRYPEMALKFGIHNIENCFHGVDVTRIVHMCCGYPRKVDQEDYSKADPSAYFTLADALEDSVMDQVSLEDAHRHNELSLLTHFKKTKVILGFVDVARSRVESVDEIKQRIDDVLQYIDSERLIVAPDCGMKLLDKKIAKNKLVNLVKAAKSSI